jgi:signal recognition particle subunit SRP54
MLVGLQGSGKTTHAGKLALRLKEQGRRTLLVAADVYRPAAIEQLADARQADRSAGVRSSRHGDPVEDRARRRRRSARLGIPTVIIDTAGRLQIDEELMDELERIKAASSPSEILFVADAMTGQEATNVAKGFNDRLGITGVILTKMDGDARGGAALSIHKHHRRADQVRRRRRKAQRRSSRSIPTGWPRASSAWATCSRSSRRRRASTRRAAQRSRAKLRKNDFTLDDFLEQLRQVRKMGSMNEIMKMIPGLSKAMPNVEIDEGDVKRVEAIICSMTRASARVRIVLNGSRRKRIAPAAARRSPT